MIENDSKGFTSFAVASLLWLAVGFFCAWKFSGPGSARTMLEFWFLSVADLFVLMKVVSSVFCYLAEESREKRAARAFQAFYWGAFKLAFVGLFILALLASKGAATSGLLFGTGTLSVVPCLGGIFWSQRVVSHA